MDRRNLECVCVRGISEVTSRCNGITHPCDAFVLELREYVTALVFLISFRYKF